MKNSSISKVCALFTLVLAAMSAGATVYRERDEINKSFTLPAKARVDVSAISGSVDIKAIDGDTVAYQVIEGRARRQQVQVGAVDGRNVEILAGLAEGAEVVLSASAQVEGAAIR